MRRCQARRREERPAQLEVDLKGERARESRRARKAAGKPWGRRPAFRDRERVGTAQELPADFAIPKSGIARRLGVASSTLGSWFPK